MPEILNSLDATARFGMPLLHPAQANKELYVNEALTIVDSLMHCQIEGERDEAPQNPSENESWIVGLDAVGAWAGRAGDVAIFRNGTWAFWTPQDGFRAFDRARGSEVMFAGYWRKPSIPVEPLGGTSVDGEARTAIKDLVSALQALGILPSA